MSLAENTAKIVLAVQEDDPDTHSMLSFWLASEPDKPHEYVVIADTLLVYGERNLAHLVASRGIALFPDNDQLARFALKLELRRPGFAA